MPVLQSVQQRKLTSILINHKNCQLFRTLLALSFIHFFPRPVFVWQKSCLLTTLYPQFLLQWCLSYVVQFRRLTSHFCFVHQFLVFILPFFSWQPSFRNVVENCFRLFLLSFSHFSIANFKQCWVISPYFSRFPPFQNSHHPSFPLPSPKLLPVLPPPILPSSRPRSTSTKLFVQFRFACTVNPLLFRSCLEILFESPLNVPLPSPLFRQKCA